MHPISIMLKKLKPGEPKPRSNRILRLKIIKLLTIIFFIMRKNTTKYLKRTFLENAKIIYLFIYFITQMNADYMWIQIRNPKTFIK